MVARTGIPPLVLPRRCRDAIDRHALACYPDECCGLLVGRRGSRVEVDEVVVAENVASDSRRRYRIDEKILLATHRTAREAGGEVVGYYHSHPRGSALASAEDRRHAVPRSSYLIVGLAEAGVADRRAFRTADERSPLVEQPLILSG